MIEPKSKCFFSIRVSAESAVSLFPCLDQSVIKSAVVSSTTFDTDMETIQHAKLFADCINGGGENTYSPLYLPNQTEKQIFSKVTDEREDAYKIDMPFTVMEMGDEQNKISVEYKPFDFPSMKEVLANSRKVLS